jgi:hypothetical protein
MSDASALRIGPTIRIRVPLEKKARFSESADMHGASGCELQCNCGISAVIGVVIEQVLRSIEAAARQLFGQSKA